MNLVARLEHWLVRLYQAWRHGKPSPCRFVPTCSTYAMEALEVHGLVKGNRLAVWRLLRCGPWGSWGADPVPVRESGESPHILRRCASRYAWRRSTLRSTSAKAPVCLVRRRRTARPLKTS